MTVQHFIEKWGRAIGQHHQEVFQQEVEAVYRAGYETARAEKEQGQKITKLKDE